MSAGLKIDKNSNFSFSYGTKIVQGLFFAIVTPQINLQSLEDLLAPQGALGGVMF